MGPSIIGLICLVFNNMYIQLLICCYIGQIISMKGLRPLDIFGLLAYVSNISHVFLLFYLFNLRS